MSLTEKIASDLMAAMKAQDKGKLEALESCKNCIYHGKIRERF